MTVKELKDIIRDWPEADASGEPTEVWVQTGSTLSSPIDRFEYLNMGASGNAWKSDLLLVPRCEEKFPKKGTLVEVLGYERPGDWGLPRKGVVT